MGRIGNLVTLRLSAAVVAIVALLGALSVTMPVASAAAPWEQECAPQDERGERPILGVEFPEFVRQGGCGFSCRFGGSVDLGGGSMSEAGLVSVSVVEHFDVVEQVVRSCERVMLSHGLWMWRMSRLIVAQVDSIAPTSALDDFTNYGGEFVDDALRGLTAAQGRSVRSLQTNIAEHEAKLAAYIDDPFAFDNLGYLANAPTPQIQQSIIQGRIRHLETEISTFADNIRKITGGG